MRPGNWTVPNFLQAIIVGQIIAYFRQFFEIIIQAIWTILKLNCSAIYESNKV